MAQPQVQVQKLTKVVVCPIIEYIGEDAVKVVEALRNITTPPDKVKCPKCGQEVESKKFALHLSKHCRFGGKNITCDICNEKFKDMGKFLRHIREHLVVGVLRNGMWVWYCTVCGREFTCKRSALVHVLKKHEVEE